MQVSLTIETTRMNHQDIVSVLNMTRKMCTDIMVLSQTTQYDNIEKHLVFKQKDPSLKIDILLSIPNKFRRELLGKLLTIVFGKFYDNVNIL